MRGEISDEYYEQSLEEIKKMAESGESYTYAAYGLIDGCPYFGIFWTPDLDAADNALDKKVFLCGGSLEDPDYADSYKGHFTTLEGLAKLNDRLVSHNAGVTYKLYNSHHYQFIPEMLTEYLKSVYGV